MTFTRVTKLNPCPVCKKPDWCRVFADGWAECMRVQSDTPAKSGGWMHSLCLVPPVARPAETPRQQPPTINATRMMRDWLAATAPAALDDPATSLGLSTPPVARPAEPPRQQPPTINATRMMRDWLAATAPAALDDLATSLGLSTPSV